MRALLANGLLVLLMGLLWASESVLGKLTLIRGANPFDFPLILNLGTVIILSSLIFSPKHRQSILNYTMKTLPWLVYTALTLVFIPYCVLYLSLRELSPAEASLMTSLTPIFSMLIGVLVFHTRIKIRSLLALSLGIIGVGLLIIPRLLEETGQSTALWYLLMLLVPLSYAASGYCLKKCSELNASYIQLLFVTNFISAGLFLALNEGLPTSYGDNNTVIYMSGIIINILAIALMLYVSGRMTPLALSFSNYATLMFSFILSVLLFSQQFSISLILAMILIILSSMVIQDKT